MDKGVLVVTGGSRGIGAATCLLGAKAGYAVVVNYARDAEAAQRVVSAIEADGGKALAVQGNVSSEADVLAIFAAADQLGPVTALVNNAGQFSHPIRVEDLDAKKLNEIFAVNITGSFLCAAQAIRRMSSKHGGKGGGIVNLTSAASKHGAIDTFTIGLALEVAAEGIRVNAVRPGIIDTDIHASGGDPGRAARLAPTIPMPRVGTAEEVAKAILWLLSDDASYTTGTTIAVTGGRAIVP
jgi:NAD(P)-dependent dehydrogenase (short-subunit alcohol dehydrogenase family)